jgi:hypothetical protein
MIRLGSLLFIVALASVGSSAQISDFPIGISGIPRDKLKGPVHTVLTIEQREEWVYSTTVDTYDSSGRLLETLSSNANIEVHSRTLVRLGGKTIYIHDTQGKLAKRKNFSPEGRYTGYETYIYDSQNRLIETRLYNPSDKETGKRTYTYFPERHEVLATWNFYYDGRIPRPNKNLLTYDEKNQWIKRAEFDVNGNPGALITFAYDADGHFISETTCCDYKFAHRYTYEYDSFGNWIERRNTYVQPNPDGTEKLDPEWMRTYRVITYFSDRETTPSK